MSAETYGAVEAVYPFDAVQDGMPVGCNRECAGPAAAEYGARHRGDARGNRLKCGLNNIHVHALIEGVGVHELLLTRAYHRESADVGASGEAVKVVGDYGMVGVGSGWAAQHDYLMAQGTNRHIDTDCAQQPVAPWPGGYNGNICLNTSVGGENGGNLAAGYFDAGYVCAVLNASAHLAGAVGESEGYGIRVGVTGLRLVGKELIAFNGEHRSEFAHVLD